jgi:hypothetical protein
MCIGTKYVVLPVAIPNRADPYAVIVADLVSKRITFYDPQRCENGDRPKTEEEIKRVSTYTKLTWKFLHDYAEAWGFSDGVKGYFSKDAYREWQSVYGHGPLTHKGSAVAAAMVMDMLMHGVDLDVGDFYSDNTFNNFER